MRTVTVFASPKPKYAGSLVEAFGRGVVRRGGQFRVVPIHDYAAWVGRTDVGCVVGIKKHARACFDALLAAGKTTIFFDKGYTRKPHFRMSVNAFQPHTYLNRPRPPDRWKVLGRPPVVAAQAAQPDGVVLFAGSSQAYCDWHGLGDVHAYAAKVLVGLRGYTARPIVYRPKPTFVRARPVRGFDYSPSGERPLAADLARSHTVVTFGSNVALEAALVGVPAIVLGDGIARPVARTRLKDVERPLFPSQESLESLANAVAYCQWTLAEMAEGLAYDSFLEIAS